MFIETRLDTINEGEIDELQLARAFVSSSVVKAFPCGRRRSEEVDTDQVIDGQISSAEKFRIPFDPEARLNTEANNRKHSSINGYTQTYLKHWTSNNMLMSIAGYLFDITLDASCNTTALFGTSLINNLETKLTTMHDNTLDDEVKAKLVTARTRINNATSIYANIRIENFQLFSGFQNYYTGVLHSQSPVASQEYLEAPVLDLLCANGTPGLSSDYYFSGLSFSTVPLTGITSTKSEYVDVDNKYTTVSLRILDKIGGVWTIHEPANLPNIAHGDTADSVVMGDLTANSLTTPKATVTEHFNVAADGDISLVSGGESTGTVSAVRFIQNGHTVPYISLVESTDAQGNSCKQLQISLGSTLT